MAISFWANETLKRSFVRLSFQVAQFFLAVLAFAIYFLPIVLHEMSDDIFLLSGILSLAFILLFLWVIKQASGGQFKESKKIIYGVIVFIFGLVNLLYFTNLIPPLPLSLKDAGVYYSVSRNNEGNYIVDSLKANWKETFKLYPNFYYKTGQPVYVYSAIFSPADLNVNIFHQWQYKDQQTKQWKTVDNIALNVKGGRDLGFRTYSKKYFNLTAGNWRVRILNERGGVIGTVRFNLINSTNDDNIEKVREVKK